MSVETVPAADPINETARFGEAIMVIRHAFTKGKELIEEAQAWPEYWQAGGMSEGSSIKRQCKTFPISTMATKGGTLKRLDSELFEAMRKGMAAYKTWHKHLAIGSDTGYDLLRYDVGDYLDEHIDDYHERRIVSAILVLNDDYKGGKLHFPQHGLALKPEAGALILFPSFYAYPHRVEPVEEGTRYAVLTWFK